MQELKTPKTGYGTDAVETTASTRQFFEDMHQVLGARPSMDPPVVVASYGPDDDPVTLLMVKIQPHHVLLHTYTWPYHLLQEYDTFSFALFF